LVYILNIINNINNKNNKNNKNNSYNNVFILTSHNHRLQKVILPLKSHNPSYGFANGFCLKIKILYINSEYSINFDIIYDGMPDKTEKNIIILQKIKMGMGKINLVLQVKILII